MRQLSGAIMVSAALVLLASTAGAQGAKPLTKCAPDAVVSGTVCMDKFEASVWRVPDPTTANKGLVKKIQQGKATVADLAKGGATQLGTASDDYAPCADSGQNCANDIYAVSLPGVTPSAIRHVVPGAGRRARTRASGCRRMRSGRRRWRGRRTRGRTTARPTATRRARSRRSAPGRAAAACRRDGAFDMVGNLVRVGGGLGAAVDGVRDVERRRQPDG